MEKVIKLQSRSGNNNYLEFIKDKTYVLKTTYPYVRVGYLDDSRNSAKFIDPSGGPIIAVGDKIEEYKVKSIDWIKGTGYTITFE